MVTKTVFCIVSKMNLCPFAGCGVAIQPLLLPLVNYRRAQVLFCCYFYHCMKEKLSPYWICQAGWGAFGLVYAFLYITFNTEPTPYFFSVLFLFLLEGLVISHLMRTVIRNYHLLQQPLTKQIVSMLTITILFSFLYAIIDSLLVVFFRIDDPVVKDYPFLRRVMRIVLTPFMFLCIWNLIYFSYHYIIKSRRDELDKIRLESLVKELELKTIKAHINPHFIFNALNSIRALVDEDPQRARTAITELSNILRSSIYAEKMETTPLKKELSIVKDYLALEHIRFEDRLQIEYEIDEDTLDLPVPPMMLQTLVENAIKHGISKQKEGGIIKVKSGYIDNHHELMVQNTGVLNGNQGNDGFGISGTIDRLQLLFGSKAFFNIYDTDDNLVEAKVVMPVMQNEKIKV